MRVYDFDNTIYRGESSVDFFWFCLRHRPTLIRFVPIVCWKLLCYKRCRTTPDAIIRWGEHVLQDFLREVPDVDRLISEFWDKHEHRIKPFYRAQQRPDDLILSGSAEPLLAEICRRLGIQQYLGSQIDLHKGRISFLCFGENKVMRYRSCYGNTPVEAFYSDSLHDLPMMRLAQQAYLVRGDQITPWAAPMPHTADQHSV